MYDIEIRRRAQRAVDRLPEADLLAVSKAILELAQKPRPRGVDKVKGAGGYWRIRQGNYRVIYDIDDSRRLVTIVGVGHRRDVYRQFD